MNLIQNLASKIRYYKFKKQIKRNYVPEVLVREIRKSDECGCPEVECDIFPFLVVCHLEDDGTGDIFIDNGDWQDEKSGVRCSGIDDLIEKARDWVSEIVDKNGWEC